jgi:uncharacterized protein
MVQAQRGRILLTGSIAGVMPGTFNAVYNASKALHRFLRRRPAA